MRDCLIAAMAAHGVGQRLPIIRKVVTACCEQIFEVSELIARVVDIPASRASGMDARTVCFLVLTNLCSPRCECLP